MTGPYLPSPADRPPVEGARSRQARQKVGAQARRISEPFCGLVFKIEAEKHGDLSYVRVYSGELKSNSRVLNPGKGKKENVNQLWHVQASRREQIDRVEVGDIVGIIIGLRALGHGRHDLRRQGSRSCWNRSSSPTR